MQGSCEHGGEEQRGQLRKVNPGVVLAGRGGGGTKKPAEESECRGCVSREGSGMVQKVS